MEQTRADGTGAVNVQRLLGPGLTLSRRLANIVITIMCRLIGCCWAGATRPSSLWRGARLIVGVGLVA